MENRFDLLSKKKKKKKYDFVPDLFGVFVAKSLDVIVFVYSL